MYAKTNLNNFGLMTLLVSLTYITANYHALMQILMYRYKMNGHLINTYFTNSCDIKDILL